jgi:hypothetical protein
MKAMIALTGMGVTGAALFLAYGPFPALAAIGAMFFVLGVLGQIVDGLHSRRA